MRISTIEIFELRPYIYGWLAIFLSTEPTAEILNDAKERFLSMAEKINSLGNWHLDEYFNNLLNAILNEKLENLLIDYTSLFLGGREGLLCPSESSYREKRIYGPTTLEVIDFYHQHGFAKEESFPEPDDHIALEFAFMSILGSRLLKIIKDEGINSPKCHHLTKVQLDFISEHLMKWIPLWVKEVEKFSETKFYKNLSSLAETFIKFDKSFLEEFSPLH